MKGATLNYGNFIQTLVDFTIVALCIFLIVKGINSLKQRTEKPREPVAPPPPPPEVVLLTEIRDLLRARQA